GGGREGRHRPRAHAGRIRTVLANDDDEEEADGAASPPRMDLRRPAADNEEATAAGSGAARSAHTRAGRIHTAAVGF
ncbi:Os01g0349600, partial [Oryza sativa Japonica Group]